MNCTMTLDMPQKEASYVARHSAQFRRELSAIALVIVQSRMQDDKDEARPALDFVVDWGKFKIQDGELDLSRENDTFREIDFG